MTEDLPFQAEQGDRQIDVASGTNPGDLIAEVAELSERIGYLRNEVDDIPAKIIAGMNPPATRAFTIKSATRAPTVGRIALLLIAGVSVAWLASPVSPLSHSPAGAVAVALILPLLCLALILGRTTSSRDL